MEKRTRSLPRFKKPVRPLVSVFGDVLAIPESERQAYLAFFSRLEKELDEIGVDVYLSLHENSESKEARLLAISLSALIIVFDDRTHPSAHMKSLKASIATYKRPIIQFQNPEDILKRTKRRPGPEEEFVVRRIEPLSLSSGMMILTHTVNEYLTGVSNSDLPPMLARRLTPHR